MIERITGGRTDLVADHIAAGGAATAQDANGVSLLQWCAYYGDVGAMRVLLAHGASLAVLGADLGLNAAAFHGHWRLCQFLIEHGTDANAAMPDTGETPLHSALAAAGTRPAHDLVVEVLLAAGADPNRPTQPGVDTGCFMRDTRTRAETPLHRAAAFASEEVVQALLDAGAKREAKDMHGDSPLSWASWHRRPDSLLRKLCYGDFHIRAGRRSMESYLLGEPHPH
jgi:ankyrin repeat protein